MRRYFAVALLLFTGPGANAAGFGTYTNDEAAIYDGWNRTSQYIEAEDGTKLAVDVYIPTAGGEEPEEKIPVVLHYTRYIRAVELDDGGVIGGPDRDPVGQHMLRHGYAFAVADARGTGASFGVRHGDFSVEETQDSYAIIQWLASQPWSNGKVGMTGRSYPGMTQYQAATQGPPALKAIFAEMAGPSAYDFIYRGGAFKKDFIDQWGSGTRDLDRAVRATPAKVDDDPDGTMREAAIREHNDNLWAQALIQPNSNLRNFHIDREGGGHWSWDRVIATIDDADAIAESGVAIYHLVGWYDIYTTQQPWLYTELDGRSPQKMIIGPWVHSGGYGGRVHLAEILRWYDYWLKDIDNGVMDEAPVHYYRMEGNHTVPDGAMEVAPTADEAAAEAGDAWVSASSWPPEAERVRFWLSEGRSGTIDSTNDGILSTAKQGEPSRDRYDVDYSSNSGSFSRWMNGYGSRREDVQGATWFDERTPENRKALTYTSNVMQEDVTISGYPTAHLTVTSTHDDGDFFIYLEEIDSDGRSHYITEGVLRATHRRTSDAPFDNMGLPFHRSHAEDLTPMTPGEPTELDFDIMGTAIVIDEGHRLRVTIAGADARNFQLHPDPAGEDAPTIEVLTGGEHASYVELPIL
jgi:putative CocE/NonD family hydrolase